MEMITKLCAYVRIYSRLAVLALLGRPYKLTLLVTSGCNLRCQICSLWQNRQACLQPEEMEEIWNAFRFAPCWVNISGGEPTLHPQLEAMLRFFVSRKRPLLITLTTNGFVDCSALIARVLERNRHSPLYVSLSMDGEEAEHDAARGRLGSYSRVVATYQRLRELQQKHSLLKLGVSVTLSRVNCAHVLPFIRRLLRERYVVSINPAQRSPYYQNTSKAESFRDLPRHQVIEVLREAQVLMPKLSLDSLIKLNFLEMVIRHLEGRYRPIPCTSMVHNVLVTSTLDLMDCTMAFRAWSSPGTSRTEKLSAIVAAIRHPSTRRSQLLLQLRASNCAQSCHTPCEKYVHILAALLNPLRAPVLLWTYARICVRSSRGAGRRLRYLNANRSERSVAVVEAHDG